MNIVLSSYFNISSGRCFEIIKLFLADKSAAPRTQKRPVIVCYGAFRQTATGNTLDCNRVCNNIDSTK